MDFIKGLGAVILVIAIFLLVVTLVFCGVYYIGYGIGLLVNIVISSEPILGITLPHLFGIFTISSVIIAIPISIVMQSHYEKAEKLIIDQNKKNIESIKQLFKEFRGY